MLSVSIITIINGIRFIDKRRLSLEEIGSGPNKVYAKGLEILDNVTKRKGENLFCNGT